ncbi:MAG: Abi-alpha family protein [Alphaproteobacteria bacterium]
MSDDHNMIPITDEQARMAQEAIKLLRDVGSFLSKALGSTPEDLVGMLGGDWLKIRRAENIARLIVASKERLQKDGVIEPQSATLSQALPILRAAADESREEIRDLWARLLAAAMDPTRANQVRSRFIDAIKQLDPCDALVLQSIARRGTKIDLSQRNDIIRELVRGPDEVDVSIQNLRELELLHELSPGVVMLSPFGREFVRIIMR